VSRSAPCSGHPSLCRVRLSAAVIAVLLGIGLPNAMAWPLASAVETACPQLWRQLETQQPDAEPASASAPATHAGAVLGPDIRLLSWNLHKGTDRGWREDLGRLSADRDLLFLQEYVPALAPRTHTHALQALHFAPGFGSGVGRSGVATLSRRDALAHCGMHSLEPWLGTPKASSVGLYPLSNGQRLLTANLHGLNFSIGSRPLALQLEQLTPLLSAHTGPIILGGDINAWSTARLRQLRAFAAHHWLTEVRFEPDQRSRAPGLGAMDYLFFRGLRLTRATVLPVRSSDHNPLLAEWQL